MKKTLCGVLILVATLAVGCTGNENVENSSGTNSETKNRDVREIVAKSANEEFETTELNYGQASYTTTQGREMPYKKRGIISMPKSEGKKKLVVMIHGSHENIDGNARFDTGFKYLTEHLAMNGYAALSLDVQAAYTWKYGDGGDNEKIRAIYKDFINELKADKSLSDKIDFDNVVLFGLSRGADTIFDIQNENEAVKAILSIAPSPGVETVRNDINTMIVVPELDGDVVDLAGISIYEELVEDNNRNNPADLVIVEGANHNYFNSDIKVNDTELLGNQEKLDRQLDKESQQTFIKNLSVDFLNSVFGKVQEDSFFNRDEVEVKSMYGIPVKTKSFSTGEEIVMNKDNFDIAKSDNENLIVKVMNESEFYKDDETKGFKLPVPNNNIKKILSVEWKSKGNTLNIDLNNKDLSKYKTINLNLALDPSNELNKTKSTQGLTIMLKDKSGNKSSVLVDDKNMPLSYVDGKLDFTEIFDDKHYYWDSYTPMSMIRIPLSLFDNVDLKNIDAVEIIFDQSDSGAIMIEDIEVA